jgi:ferredoxin hydrogenase large subunit
MIKIDSDKCTGCGICTHICPQSVLELAMDKASLAHESRCVECGACMLNCPFGAINVTKGTGCLVAIIKEDILKISKKGKG